GNPDTTMCLPPPPGISPHPPPRHSGTPAPAAALGRSGRCLGCSTAGPRYSCPESTMYSRVRYGLSGAPWARQCVVLAATAPFPAPAPAPILPYPDTSAISPAAWGSAGESHQFAGSTPTLGHRSAPPREP